MNIRLKGMQIFLGLDEPEYLSRKGKSKSTKTENELIDTVIKFPKIKEYSSLRSNMAVNHRAKARATKSAIRPSKKSVKTKEW